MKIYFINSSIKTLLAITIFYLTCHFSQGAPDVKQKPLEIDYKELKNCFNKSHLSQETSKLRSKFHDFPEAEYSEFFGKFFLIWKKQGVRLIFNGESKLEQIALHSGYFNDFSKYQGELPERINLSDEPEQIEKKLGKPDEIFIYKEFEYCDFEWTYVKQKIRIIFKKHDNKDKIAEVWLYAKEPPIVPKD